MGAGPVRFRYSDLNEAGRVCGGCAVYVISIARRGRMWASPVFSEGLAARRGGRGSEIGSRKHIRIKVDGTLRALVSSLDAQEE